MHFSTALIVLLGVAAASAHHGAHGEVHDMDLFGEFDLDNKANMNAYFDDVLAQMRVYMLENNMVPFALPDSLHGFCVRVLFVDWHGELELTHGSLTDLTTIARRGDAELFYGDKQMNIKAVIGFDFLQLKYDYLAYIMNIGPDGGIIGTVKDVTFDVDILVNLTSGESRVDHLNILSTGSLDVKLTGTIIIDAIANAIADVITFLFKGVIMDLIALTLKIVINSVLENMGVPSTPAPMEMLQLS